MRNQSPPYCRYTKGQWCRFSHPGAARAFYAFAWRHKPNKPSRRCPGPGLQRLLMPRDKAPIYRESPGHGPLGCSPKRSILEQVVSDPPGKRLHAGAWLTRCITGSNARHTGHAWTITLATYAIIRGKTPVSSVSSGTPGKTDYPLQFIVAEGQGRLAECSRFYGLEHGLPFPGRFASHSPPEPSRARPARPTPRRSGTRL